jgi:hypothetical protein
MPAMSRREGDRRDFGTGTSVPGRGFADSDCEPHRPRRLRPVSFQSANPRPGTIILILPRFLGHPDKRFNIAI